MKDEIKKQFGAIAMEYDSQRKSLIPCFNDFYSSILECVSFSKNHDTILDIGAGTGLLTSVIFEKYPNSNYTLIDISDEMILQAQKRFSALKNFEYLTADYVTYPITRKYDIVVSSLSIHHLEDAEKATLYKKIYSIIKPGGIFINGDQFIHKSQFVEKIIHSKWKLIIAYSPLKKEEIEAAYERMKMDKPATTEKNMKWMEDAGFSNVELIYKYFPFGVIFGLKE